VVAALLSRGANARAADPNGRTGVMFAVKRGDLEMLRSLLTAGADVNSSTWEGTRAIHVAFQVGRFDMMNVLLDSGADASLRKILSRSIAFNAKPGQLRSSVTQTSARSSKWTSLMGNLSSRWSCWEQDPARPIL